MNILPKFSEDFSSADIFDGERYLGTLIYKTDEGVFVLSKIGHNLSYDDTINLAVSIKGCSSLLPEFKLSRHLSE